MIHEIWHKLIIFTRWPEPGLVKTRLIPALGPKIAAELQQCMTEDMVKLAGEIHTAGRVHFDIYYDGGHLSQMAAWLGPDLQYHHQTGGDLGHRLEAAFLQAFGEGYRRVAVIGTDCPLLNPQILEHAFAHLDRHDISLGPAEDGGYYLIGFNIDEFTESVFKNMPWSSPRVLSETLKRLAHAGKKVYQLPTLFDIDTVDDVKKLLRSNLLDPETATGKYLVYLTEQKIIQDW